ARAVLGGVSFDPNYLTKAVFPGVLGQIIAQKLNEDPGSQLAMAIYPSEYDIPPGDRVLASTGGWGKGAPEIARKFDDVFRGLTLGIRFQGTTVEAIANRWVQHGFLILGVLSLLLIGGVMQPVSRCFIGADSRRCTDDFAS